MSLLLLYRPTPSGVIITPPPTEEGPPVLLGPKRRVPPPELYHFPAGTARVLVRAGQPALLIIPPIERVTLSLSVRSPQYELDLTSQIVKHPPPSKYRAVRDEKRDDEEFLRLIEDAFLLTR